MTNSKPEDFDCFEENEREFAALASEAFRDWLSAEDECAFANLGRPTVVTTPLHRGR